MKQVDHYKELAERVLYCEDCLQAWEKGRSNLDSLDKPCPHCSSLYASGITKERMRELKIKRLIE